MKSINKLIEILQLKMRNVLTSFADCGIYQSHHIDYKLIETVDGCIPIEF